MKRITAFAFVLLSIYTASAFNHPELHWKSVTTDHFIFNYYDKTEPAVYAAWKIAEDAYSSLSALYEFTPKDKIAISLADYSDYSNGFAGFTNGSIMIWVPDIRFDLRGNNTWLRNVITHELAHIFTLEKKATMQLLDWTVGVSYASNKDTAAYFEPFALSRFWPAWLTEGIAQRESERKGNDCWDSRRNMLLSDAVINNKALSLAAMGEFNHDGLGNEMVYNQGFSFVKFIEEKIGKDNLARIFNSGRNKALFSNSFSALIQEQTGTTIEALYLEWLDDVKRKAQNRLPQNPTPTTTIWNKGNMNSFPKISPDGKWWGWLTNNRDDGSRTDLVIAQYGSSNQYMTIKWALTSWDFSADSKNIFFIKAHELSDNGSNFNDLYRANIDTKQETRLTRGARIYDVAACPDNSNLACVKFSEGAYSIVTTTTDCSSWQTIVKGQIGEPFAGLSFSPEKTTIASLSQIAIDTADSASHTQSVKEPEYKIATTKCINGKATLCIIGYKSNAVAVIGKSVGQDEFPHWAKNGRIYYSADYDGISNIYSVKPDGSNLLRHSTATFGMFAPCTDNNKLLCVAYGNQAFSIVECENTAGIPYVIPESYACSFTDLPRPKGDVSIRANDYEAKMRRSTWSLQTIMQVDDEHGTVSEAFKANRSNKWMDSANVTYVAGLSRMRTDALEKNTELFGVAAMVGYRGYKRPDTLTTNSNGMFFNDNIEKNRNRFFSNRNNVATTNKTIETMLAMSRLNKTASSQNGTTTSSDTTKTSSQWGFGLIPSYQISNNQHLISYGFNASVLLAAMILPQVITLGGDASVDLSRDISIGISPSVSVYTLPVFMIPKAELPLWISYMNYDYVNADMAYNLGGLTQMQAYVIPQSVAAVSQYDDSTVTQASLTISGVSFFHSFPVTKYSAIKVHLQPSYYSLSDQFEDPFMKLAGRSSEYFVTSAGTSLVFPLFRQINSGITYMDALYGDIGYDLMFHTNTMNMPSDVITSFTTQHYGNKHVYVGHVLSAGVKLGFMKSYAFSRTLVARCYWNIWEEKAAMNVSVGF